MKSWTTPTPEQVSRAIALLAQLEQYRYFFDRLKNPEWLGPLSARGFFKHPPVAIRDEAKGTISFPPWPESQYLTRMAAIPEAQDKVAEIALAIPSTENVRVHEDLAEVAIALPASLATRFVPRAKRWLDSPYPMALPEKLGSLVGHLARGGAPHAALDLARELLAIFPDPQSSNAAAQPAQLRTTPEPTARFDTWYYERILEKHLGELVDAAGMATFAMLCDLLERAIQISLSRAEALPPEDYSWIWRPAIEQHEQNRSDDIKDVLVSAVRDTVERLAASAPELVSDLVGMLDTRPWIVFHRVALHLLRRYPDASRALLEEHLLNRDTFGDPRVRHEYVLLAAQALRGVSDKARSTLLEWIDAGPDLEKFRALHRSEKGVDPSDEDVNRYGRMWRRDRLAPLLDALPQQWQRRYEQFVHEFGEPEHPEFPAYLHMDWVGPTSPKSAEELGAIPVSGVVDFLRTWLPSGDPFAPSREGLSRELSSTVKANPGSFARGAGRFVDVDPTYVRALLIGLNEAVREDHAFDWAPVMDLCSWVVRQPRELGERRRIEGEDPNWEWTRKAIADLIDSGLGERTCGLPFALRDRTWTVLRVLTDDPNPTPAYEAKYGGSNMDPPMLSINTIRGQAMHTVVSFALWVRRHLGRARDESGRAEFGLSELPEVREVLECHLEPAYDPSLAVRSVYGQKFPWLVFLDKVWTSIQVGRIFPVEHPDLRDVAWESYIVYCHPYDNVLSVLEREYADAVERLVGRGTRKRSRSSDPDERLAQHLMVFYGRGKLSGDSEAGLIAKFFDRASSTLRGRAIEFVGRSLSSNREAIPALVLERFVALWEHRVVKARAAPGDFIHELESFSWWFASRKFDEIWALGRLEEALRLAQRIKPHYVKVVIEALSEVAVRKPLQTVRCLESLVDKDVEGWGMIASEDHMRAILAAAIRSDDVEAREVGTALVHRLGARGYMTFRDLLGS